MLKHLIVLDTYPSDINLARLNTLLEDCVNAGQQLHIFFMEYGVFYLLDGFWKKIRRSQCQFYAHAYDVARYNIAYRDDVVLSGMPAFQQMLDTIPMVTYLKDKDIFPSPLLTQKK